MSKYFIKSSIYYISILSLAVIGFINIRLAIFMKENYGMPIDNYVGIMLMCFLIYFIIIFFTGMEKSSDLEFYTIKKDIVFSLLIAMSIESILYINSKTKIKEYNISVAYSYLEKETSLYEGREYYTKFQKEFIHDAKNKNADSLEIYIKNKNDLKSIGEERLSNLILLMNNIKDSEIKEEFEKIITDKVITYNEYEEFNKKIIKYKMDNRKYK